jgi:hypothetical protein
MLAHEEMDAMRSMVIATTPHNPTGLVARYSAGAVILNWTAGSPDETGFTIERALDTGFTLGKVQFNVGPAVRTYSDATIAVGTTYYYRVYANNLVGDSFDYTVQNPQAVNFPTMLMVSGNSNVYSPLMPPSGTSRMLTLTQGGAASAPVVMTWSYAGAGGQQSGFTIQRATNPTFTTGVVNYSVAGNVYTYMDAVSTMSSGVKYYYRVAATNSAGAAAWSGFMQITVHTPPPAGTTTMTKLSQAVAQGSPILLTWTYSPGGDQGGFIVQRATNAAFTAGVRNVNVGPDVYTFSDTLAGLKVGTTYYYRVIPFNGAGNGAASNAMSIVVHR